MFDEKAVCPKCEGGGLSFKEGATKAEIKGDYMPAKEECESCAGTGLKYHFLWGVCVGCDGSGNRKNGMPHTRCGGFGYVLRSEAEQESTLMDWWFDHSLCRSIDIMFSPRGYRDVSTPVYVVMTSPGLKPSVGVTRLEALKAAIGGGV